MKLYHGPTYRSFQPFRANVILSSLSPYVKRNGSHHSIEHHNENVTPVHVIVEKCCMVLVE